MRYQPEFYRFYRTIRSTTGRERQLFALEAAAKATIPQVMSAGVLDTVNFGRNMYAYICGRQNRNAKNWSKYSLVKWALRQNYTRHSTSARCLTHRRAVKSSFRAGCGIICIVLYWHLRISPPLFRPNCCVSQVQWQLLTLSKYSVWLVRNLLYPRRMAGYWSSNEHA